MAKTHIDNFTGWFWRWGPSARDKTKLEVHYCDDDKFNPSDTYCDEYYMGECLMNEVGPYTIFMDKDNALLVVETAKKCPDEPLMVDSGASFREHMKKGD
jgi:hypothetical protein